MNLKELATDRIIHFHEQIGRWFRGEMNATEKEEMLALNDFHSDFRMISPTGIVRNLPDLALWLPSVYEAKPGIILEVRDISLRFEQGDAVLMEYIEIQSSGETINKRISTALFVKAGEGLQWQHLHETFLH